MRVLNVKELRHGYIKASDSTLKILYCLLKARLLAYPGTTEEYLLINYLDDVIKGRIAFNKEKESRDDK
jgi:hypothetical protein